MRTEGEVTWFNERKGFGFIKGDDGLELFVHYTEITRDGFQTLDPGERVSYEVSDADRGPKAVEVRVVGEKTHGSFI
ncbi:cold-shock protein [Salidesulfovibrio onnuriiensis]|uniref:cold-shock protein n=1 Tax=Salidesulfovibrio onnuriiensis TaxID=2583823 RepID=UPI0011CA0B3E|nr:cold-shock protein [Salidesulfovibrio onnuriiensis]